VIQNESKLLAWIPFDESGVNSAGDLSGWNNHVSGVNTPTWTTPVYTKGFTMSCYTFPGTANPNGGLNLGAVYYNRLYSNVSAVGVSLSDLIDSITPPIDSWGLFDGDPISDVTANLYVRAATASGNENWSDWQKFSIADYKARYIGFKLLMKSEDSNHNLYVGELHGSVYAPERTEFQNDMVVTATSGTTVTFSNNFYTEPAVAISIRAMAGGDYYNVVSKSRIGFTVQILNSGLGVARNIDWMAKGYGKEVT